MSSRTSVLPRHHSTTPGVQKLLDHTAFLVLERDERARIEGDHAAAGADRHISDGGCYHLRPFMAGVVLEWLNLVFRIAHIVAAIMWIGDSFLFMWLDSSLSKPKKEREGDVVGELWMAHSGGFYEVVKRKSLTELPERLFWFKWESYTTWVTGFLLLMIVYWHGGRAMMLEATSQMTQGQAIGLSFGLLVAGVVIYDLLCRTPIIKDNKLFGVVGLILMTALAHWLTTVLTPRAAFLQTGAMLGTIMASNVFFRIIPAQKHMLAATKEGKPVDTSYGVRAKQRSTHNHYLTFPVLFTMLANHFPSLYSHKLSWAILALIFVAAAGTKFIMNFRTKTHPVALIGTLASLGAVAFLTLPPGDSDAVKALASHAKVDITAAREIIQTRCISCHSSKPTDKLWTAAPVGVVLDTPEQMQAYAPRILFRAYDTKSMPLGNQTGMTDEERLVLGAWAYQARGH